MRRKTIDGDLRIDATRIAIIGHSMGGFLAAHTVAGAADLFRSRPDFRGGSRHGVRQTGAGSGGGVGRAPPVEPRRTRDPRAGRRTG
ncbi:MAG: hypothetical protein EOO38_24680, partial [Cytophagaceae bacterium]